MLNSVILAGVVKDDPEARLSQNNGENLMVTRLKLVDMKAAKPDANKDAIDVIAFGPVAEKLDRRAQAGTCILISGRLRADSYVTDDGKKIYRKDLIADEAWIIAEAEMESNPLNRVALAGRAVSDPFVTYVTNEKGQLCIARFTLANQRPKRKGAEPETDFHSLVAFGKTAEFVEKYVRKGSLMTVTGKLKPDSYVSKKTNIKKDDMEVVIDDVELMGKKPDAATRREDVNGYVPPQQQFAPQGQPMQGAPADDGFMNMADVELPDFLKGADNIPY